MEEVSAAADGLAKMAGELEALAGHFKLKMKIHSEKPPRGMRGQIYFTVPQENLAKRY